MIRSSAIWRQFAERWSKNEFMEQLFLPSYFNLGAAIGRLTNVPVNAPVDAVPDEKWVAWRLGNEVHSQLLWLYGVGGLLKAPQVAHDFLSLLNQYFDVIKFRPEGAPAPLISEANARTNLIARAMDLQAVVMADIQRMAVYSVPKQGAYDTTDLIDSADAVLPVEVRAKLSEMALREVRESGRCLAYGVSTACGFHIMRAVEEVLRMYCQTIPEMRGTKDQVLCLPKNRAPTWGDCTAFLEYCKLPDVVETRALLHPLGKNQRDYIMHPEKVLTPNEAYSLFQEGQSAINRMALRLPDLPTIDTPPFGGD